jgi:hypothetical protein
VGVLELCVRVQAMSTCNGNLIHTYQSCVYTLGVFPFEKKSLMVFCWLDYNARVRIQCYVSIIHAFEIHVLVEQVKFVHQQHIKQDLTIMLPKLCRLVTELNVQKNDCRIVVEQVAPTK